VSKFGSIVALESCTDGSATRLYLNDKYVGQSRVGQVRSYFDGSPGSLKIVYSEYKEVERC
ncbi:MAG: hypothetical protein ACLGHZ_07880, partial [Actinomycetes bacterium]